MSGMIGGGGGGSGTLDHAALTSHLDWLNSAHTLSAAGKVAASNAASTAAVELSYTTVGSNILGLTNPGAVTFIKIAADNTVSTRSAAQMLGDIGGAASGANTDITSVYLNNTGLKVKDTNASHGLIIAPGSDITADRTLTLTTGDADRTVTVAGSTTIPIATQTVTIAGPTQARTYTFPDAAATIVSLDGTQTLTNKTLGTTTMSDAANIVLDTTTGTQIGTSTTQKLAFFGSTPLVQQAAISAASGGATVDSQARTAINALLVVMRASTGFGFIA